MATIPSSIVREQMMADPEFRKEYDALEEEFSLIEAMIEARSRANMTQADVAKAMGVTQPQIVRIESGKNVSLKSLRRYAKATGSTLKIVLESTTSEDQLGANPIRSAPSYNDYTTEGFRDPAHSPTFHRYIGVDYSGAETADACLKGLRAYVAEETTPPIEIHTTHPLRKYWSRDALAEWLVKRLHEDIPTLVGIDHGFSFPLRYFEKHGLPHDWSHFLDDFQAHWPTDSASMYVDFIREGVFGNGAARTGSSRWRRLTEERTGRAKSVFHFDVPGSVAKSTHAGLPWLRFIRQHADDRVHFWPFDGWDIPAGKSVLAEVYPSLWSRSFPREDRTSDQHDAYCVAERLRQADKTGELTAYCNPELSASERTVTQIEGWILGVR